MVGREGEEGGGERRGRKEMEEMRKEGEKGEGGDEDVRREKELGEEERKVRERSKCSFAPNDIIICNSGKRSNIQFV